MPCGCFGGGGKKKGSPRGSEAPPKPPKLPLEEPIKQQQQQVSAYTAQPTTLSRPENGTLGGGTGNGQVNGTATPAAEPTPVVSTPTSESQSAVDGGSTKSSGARSRAELYAKRREFFRPLYDVSLSSTTPNNQRFNTPRSSNTLPSRGKRGAYLMGDGSGYFTAEGRYVAGETGGSGGDGVVSADLMSGDGGRETDGSSSFLVNTENHYVDEDGRVVDRPPRPTSQPSGLAGQWEELMDQEGEPSEGQDEFHQKHKQIIHQQQQQPGFIPPPPPKEVNPHFIEFQEKHHKILYDPESRQHHKTTDPELAQKLAVNRLTELDKLHNEVQKNYEKRMKNGPVDVDSLVEQYTEERWKKMVENWEREGLVVEGGIVVVDDKGNAVERKMTSSPDGGFVVEKVTRVTERVDDDGETVIEGIEQEGNKFVRVVETNREITIDNDRFGTVKHTEEILIEQFNDNPPTSVTTIVTPPTPQIDVSSKTTPLADLTEDQIAAVERELERDEQYTSEQQNPSNNNQEDYLIEEDDADDTEPLIEMAGDDLLKNAHKVIELERLLEESSSSDLAQPSDSPSDDPYRVSPPPSPPASPSQSVPPQTCTPPPSPQREHRAPSPTTGDISIVCGGGQTDIVLTKSSATPPPSPPLQAAAEQ